MRHVSHYLLLTTHHSPLTTHHSPLTTHHSPLTSHLSPLASHLSPLASHLSPLASRLSPLTYCAQGQQLLAAALDPNAALAGEAGAPQAGARLAALVKATEGYRRESAEACAH